MLISKYNLILIFMLRKSQIKFKFFILNKTLIIKVILLSFKHQQPIRISISTSLVKKIIKLKMTRNVLKII